MGVTLELTDEEWEGQRNATTQRFFGIDADEFVAKFEAGELDGQPGLSQTLMLFPELRKQPPMSTQDRIFKLAQLCGTNIDMRYDVNYGQIWGSVQPPYGGMKINVYGSSLEEVIRGLTLEVADHCQRQSDKSHEEASSRVWTNARVRALIKRDDEGEAH